jgi:hypothetical protein
VAVALGGVLRGQIVRLGILSAGEAPLVDIAQGVGYLSRDGTPSRGSQVRQPELDLARIAFKVVRRFPTVAR